MSVSYTVDDVSEHLFGHRQRLRVYAWVLSATGAFFQHEVAAALQIRDNAVAPHLSALIALEMVEKKPRLPTDRCQWLTRAESQLWECVRAALAAAEASA